MRRVVYYAGVGLPLENFPARTVIKASLTSNSSRTAPKLSLPSASHLNHMTCRYSPVASHLGEQLGLDDFNLLLGQVSETVVLDDLRPRHNRRDLPIKG
jgi:hypothetical protein